MKTLNRLADTEPTTTHPAPNSYFGYYYPIAQSKFQRTKRILANIERFIINNYQDYSNRFQQDTLEGIAPHNYNPTDQKALKDCYVISTQKLVELKLAINNAQANNQATQCQYCGIDSPSTFDHYLPKDQFPEFSVMPLNLVPCCSSCNSKKLDTWRDAHGRVFIHFYLDRIDSYQFLYADFIITGNIPKIVFRLDRPNNMPVQLFLIVEKHFTRLGLLKKYNEHSATEYAGIIEMLEDFEPIRQLTLAEITEILAKRATRSENNYGKNFWKTVLIKTIATSAIILQNIRNLRLGK